MTHTICTFNANNLFARYKFGNTFPGDMSARSRLEDPTWGYLPLNDSDLIQIFNEPQRWLSAQALARGGDAALPDVVVLQEIESLLALRKFNEAYLASAYPNALLVDSRDFRQIDVGILSTLPIVRVRSHVDDLDLNAGAGDSPWLYSRDCLEVVLDVGNRLLTLFINHFKSKLVLNTGTLEERLAARAAADAKRQRQAEAVRALVRARFPGNRFQSDWFAVLGDLNDEPESASIRPLTRQAGLVDALERIPQEPQRWTHWWRSGSNIVSQLDHVLLSPALDAATAGSVPVIERRGISFDRILQDGKTGPRVTHFHSVEDDPAPVNLDFQFDRFDDVTSDTYASDHCPIFFDVP